MFVSTALILSVYFHLLFVYDKDSVLLKVVANFGDLKTHDNGPDHRG